MRALLIAILLTIPAAQAADARKYAVLSMLGDSMQIVVQRNTTGSRIDRNDRQTVPLSVDAVDRVVLLTVARQIERLDPQSEPILMRATDPAIVSAQTRILESEASLRTLEEPVRAALAGRSATHLILVMKLRHETRIKLGQEFFGTGTLEGVGLYIDRSKRSFRGDTLEQAWGYMAPYAYFRIALIDLQRFDVIRDESIVTSQSYSASRAPNGDPWDALSAEQKIRVLQQMVERETARVVPMLLQQDPR